MKVVIGK